jgi:hypothetical protein
LQQQLDGLALALERPQDASSDALVKVLLPQVGEAPCPAEFGVMQRLLQTQLQLALHLVPHLFEQMTLMVKTRLPAVLQGSPLA